jgi:hypothetical protein
MPGCNEDVRSNAPQHAKYGSPMVKTTFSLDARPAEKAPARPPDCHGNVKKDVFRLFYFDAFWDTPMRSGICT